MANGFDQAEATGLAGGAISAALLEALFDKGVLNLAFLDRALVSLSPVIRRP